MLSKLLISVAVIFVAYYFSYMNSNDFILMPWNIAFGVCYMTKQSCFETLEYWSKFAEDNIDWELERRTYYNMYKGETYQVREMDYADYDFEKLREYTRDFQLPAVVRGMFEGTPAVNKWNDPNYFLERFGDDELIVLENGGVIDAEKYAATVMTDIMKQDKKTPDKCRGGYASMQKARVMSLREAIEGMQAGKKYYLSNVDTIFRKHNDLLNETELPLRLKPWAYENYRPSAAQIFMGFGSKDETKSTGTSLHCAWGTNAFCQLAGCKGWQFIPSRYSAFVHPLLSSKFPAAASLKFPEFLPRFNTTICAGDLLLNPSWMWHRIINKDGFSIGIATRENHPLWQMRNSPAFTLLHELSQDNKVSGEAIDWFMKGKPQAEINRIKMFMSIPLLAFSIGYVKELFGGLQPHPLIDAWTNTCDEHDPRCAASFYDRMVYSYDECVKDQVPDS